MSRQQTPPNLHILIRFSFSVLHDYILSSSCNETLFYYFTRLERIHEILKPLLESKCNLQKSFSFLINERRSIVSCNVNLVFVERYFQLINLTFKELEKFIFEKLSDRKKGNKVPGQSSNQLCQVHGRSRPADTERNYYQPSRLMKDSIP